jgi:chromosome segregation ATPase
MHSLKFERDQMLRQVEELKSKSLFSDESFKRESALRRSLQEEKEELRNTLSEMSSRIEKETHQKDCLGKDLQMAEKIQGELKEKLQSTENSKFPLLTEIENLKSQVSTLKHDDQLHKKVIDEKDVTIQRLESKLSSSNKEKKQLSSQIRVLKRELVLLSGMNESELKTAIDCICAKYSL